MAGLTMRESRVLRQLRAGKVATSIKLNMADPRLAEIAAICGFDCIWTDMEHVPNSFSDVENIVRAAKTQDVDVLTRVSKGCYSDYIRPFEADSAGIMIPHVMSLEEAKQIVYFTKFHPIGRRPIDGGNADGKFCMIDANEYMRAANEQRFVVIQIEDPEPMEELDEICALEGLDMIFFGPADFSQGAGYPNEFNNPKLIEAKKRVAYTARKHGKFAGTVGGLGNQDELIAMGYQFINLGSDVGALIDNFRNTAANGANKTAIDFKNIVK